MSENKVSVGTYSCILLLLVVVVVEWFNVRCVCVLFRLSAPKLAAQQKQARLRARVHNLQVRLLGGWGTHCDNGGVTSVEKARGLEV